MSGRIIPDGKKIKELRTKLGHLQKEFAGDCGFGDRTYRDIENKNTPVTSAKLQNIASRLKVSPQDLVLPTATPSTRSQSNTVAQVFELQRQPSAAKILNRRWGHVIECELLVDLQTIQATQLEELLTLVEHSWRAYLGDFLNARDRKYREEPPDCIVGKRFPEIHLRARAQELLTLLEEGGIGVFMGSHTFRYFEKWDDTQPITTNEITWFKFSGADKASITQPYNMGYVFNETTKKWQVDPAEGPDRMPF